MSTKIKNTLKEKNTSITGCAPQSRWLKIDAVIHEWLKERQEVWVLYTQLSSNTHMLETFCQILVDYIAAGHFKIYQKLVFAQEMCTPDNPTCNQHVLENILETTPIALDFNDQHVKGENVASLAQDLSFLGEHLAHRMECEDQLVQRYFEITQKLQ